MSGYLTLDEVAQKLQTGADVVKGWVMRKEFPGLYDRDRGSFCFRAQDIDQVSRRLGLIRQTSSSYQLPCGVELAGSLAGEKRPIQAVVWGRQIIALSS